MIDYSIWGGDNIDEGSRDQMQNAFELPSTRKAALMPDAHLGYGLPIGGVLAAKDAVVPYGVGMDIACRMRLTIVDTDLDTLSRVTANVEGACDRFDSALREGTRFGVGCEYTRSGRLFHPVMDHSDWKTTPLLRELHDLAWKQLGTSGSGNHFAEWGLVYLDEDLHGLAAGQHYVALMTHSGSRGPGSKVCRHYTKIAKAANPAGELSWLDMNTEDGQEYWIAMNLMGEYAAANHQLIHGKVLQLAGLTAATHIENHHNFAWQEVHDGEDLIVHRKGATPAAKGELGVIPGSMATPAHIVRGKGNPASINSASHGAGRAMSRKAAKAKFTWDEWRPILEARCVRLLGGGIDEVPGAYKPIEGVIQAQTDLVDSVGQFFPRIVMMAG
jgi:tRNA-splicing ligase RtcB